MDLLAEPPLRPNAEAVTDQKHPDHEFRIDRGAPCMAVERSEVPAKLAEIEKPIDASQKVLGWYVCFEVEGVEELVLRVSLMPHHLCGPPLFLLTLGHKKGVVVHLFFNTIGQERSFAGFHSRWCS
jgi:hypothetical protein